MMSDRAKTELASTHSLPDFRRPPVVETSLGFHFSPVPEWNVVHVGALWELFKNKYPKPEYLPPINITGDPQRLPAEIFRDVGKLPFRACFVDAANSQLVQVQSNCFFHNWRKTASTPQYEHFDVIRPVFAADWETFRGFLTKHSLPTPGVSRCEVTYFNHLVRGEDWQDMSELSRMFPSLHVTKAEGMLSRIETSNLIVIYDTEYGKLQIGVSPGVRQTDGKEVISLTVTAWSSAEGSFGDPFQCLDVCHRNAVLGFVEFTSERLQERWERIR